VSATESANNFPAKSRTEELLVSRNTWREAVRKALNLYVGRGRRYTVKELSNATGVADRIIESAKLDPGDPDFRPLREENLASVGKFLGAPFVSIWLETMGLGAFELMDGQIPLPGVLAAQEAADTAEIVSRAADGEFDADDREALKAVGHREIQRGMTLVSLGQAA
jgi:hypothetical protein